MATYTTHFNLDKYEGTDRPNLRDQYNSAMDKIDTELYEQGTEVAAATAAVGTLGTRVTAAETAVSTEATARQSADERLQQEIDNISVTEARTVVVIGDSFTDWSTNWLAQFSSTTGRPVISHAVGGTGFIGGTKPFGQQLSDAIRDDDMAAVSDIIVYGGVNDFTNENASPAQELSAIMSFYQTYYTIPASIRPNLHLCFSNIGVAQRAAYNGFGTWYESVMISLRENGLPGVVDNVPYWHFNRPNMFGGDNLHPNSAGMQVIASYMSDIINGTYSGVHVKQTFPIIHDGVQVEGRIYVAFHNGIVTVSSSLQGTITWNNVQNDSLQAMCEISGGANQYSIIFGSDGQTSSTDWNFAPTINIVANNGYVRLNRLMFNPATKTIYYNCLGDSAQAPAHTFTINSAPFTWTVAPGGYRSY